VAHPRTRRLDIAGVLERVGQAGGPTLTPLEPMGQGAVGAWLVRWPDGRTGVLTWAPPAPPNAPAGGLDRALALMDVARGAGLPVPRVQAVIPLPAGDVVIVQERAAGVPVPTPPGPALIDHVIELTDRRRGLLHGHPPAGEATSLSLSGDGPGYCLHGPLAEHDHRTRALLERIEAIGADPGADALRGDDLVHFDYHLGNVLTDARDADRVTAIVDWGGARGGDVALDLAVLAFDLTRRAPALAARVERRLLETTTSADVRRIWAHVALRMVDWSLRHHPEHLDHWLGVAPRHL
jgi:aminoglycoside phosphotransferase (APT) family kinase protein